MDGMGEACLNDTYIPSEQDGRYLKVYSKLMLVNKTAAKPNVVDVPSCYASEIRSEDTARSELLHGRAARHPLVRKACCTRTLV